VRPILSAVLVVGTLTILPAVAFAHAHLAGAVPAADSTVTSIPTEVSLHFTEALEPRFSSIEVESQGGQRVDSGAPHLAANDPKHFTVGLKPLAAGTYKVIWHATSVDTHKTEGSYRFTVKP
jgi:copper resistance protein C